MTRLTIVVPAFNAAAYLPRALDSLVDVAGDLEVVVIDDGSTDETGAIADRYAAAHPELIRVVHQPNAGHGGAINTGIDAARGTYVKVLDSDDWLDPAALEDVLARLIVLDEHGGVDAVVTDFVHERAGKRPKRIGYVSALPVGEVIGWDAVASFGRRQYLMMHSLIYRTQLLRDAGMRLPTHTFYVDNLYVVLPLLRVRRLVYFDIVLYRYFIGRDDQSVNEVVMVRRVDQQVRVNLLVLASLPVPGAVPEGLREYLLHHLEILCAITSVTLARGGTADHLAKRAEFWDEVWMQSPEVYTRVRRTLVGTGSNLPGSTGRWVSGLAYQLARRVVGFS